MTKVFPSRIGLTIAKVCRDVFLLGCGVFTLLETPGSIERSSLHGHLAVLWSAMLIVGAVAAAAGVFADRPKIEIYGCSLVGFALVVWGVAAVTQPEVTLTSWTIACLCWAGTSGQFYRVFGIVWAAGLPKAGV